MIPLRNVENVELLLEVSIMVLLNVSINQMDISLKKDYSLMVP